MNRADLLSRTLVLLNRSGHALGEEVRQLERLGLVHQMVDFGQLGVALPELEQLMQKCLLDFLLFAQNDQVLDKKDIGSTIRALRAGYSSFSGIDDTAYLAQTRQCLQDFITGQGKLNLPSGVSLQSAWKPGTLGFALIFDTEQLGGVRFGLPRILDLLERHRTPVTFFVTGFVASIYPELLPALRDRGHAVGIHGHYHEYLSGQDLSTQIRLLTGEKIVFEKEARMRGANFIFRMDQTTVEALVASGFDYFLVSMEHIYFPLAYRKMPVQPFLLWTRQGSIWMIPVSVETYNRPFLVVRYAADSAIHQAKRESAPVLSVLMHPFRDGSLRHIGALEKLLTYLRGGRSLLPVTLNQAIEHWVRPEPTVFIYVALGDGEMSGYSGLHKKGLSSWQWHNFAKYWQRVGHLYTSLKRLGHHPALCLMCPQDKPVFAIYPHLAETATTPVSLNFDPLAYSITDTHWLSILDQHSQPGVTQNIVFMPSSSLVNEVKGVFRSSKPQQSSDWLGLFPEVTARFVLRLTGYRHIF